MISMGSTLFSLAHADAVVALAQPGHEGAPGPPLGDAPNGVYCTATRDSPHRKLLAAVHAELANQEHVERRAQRGRDFVADRDATSWKRQDHDVATVPVAAQEADKGHDQHLAGRGRGGPARK